MKEKAVFDFIRELCKYAGEDGAFAENFHKKLSGDEEIYEEFIYYMTHGNFACKAKVRGYTVVDIMVWQIDHFKANLDHSRGGSSYAGGHNGDRMLLMAFHTMLKMEQDPERYVSWMQTETGTDYAGKYE